jgi:hypothetical protein
MLQRSLAADTGRGAVGLDALVSATEGYSGKPDGFFDCESLFQGGGRGGAAPSLLTLVLYAGSINTPERYDVLCCC